MLNDSTTLPVHNSARDAANICRDGTARITIPYPWEGRCWGRQKDGEDASGVRAVQSGGYKSSRGPPGDERTQSSPVMISEGKIVLTAPPSVEAAKDQKLLKPSSNSKKL